MMSIVRHIQEIKYHRETGQAWTFLVVIVVIVVVVGLDGDGMKMKKKARATPQQNTDVG
jgi:hypothetical protein